MQSSFSYAQWWYPNFAKMLRMMWDEVAVNRLILKKGLHVFGSSTVFHTLYGLNALFGSLSELTIES